MAYRKGLDIYIFQDFRNTTGFIQKNLLSDFNDRITEIAEKECFKKVTIPVSGKPLKNRQIYDIIYYECLSLYADTDVLHPRSGKGLKK